MSDRGPYLGSAWFVGNETLSVVQQGLNDDLDNADGEQGHKSAYRDFRAAIRIEFVEVFHNVFSPVDFELKLRSFAVAFTDGGKRTGLRTAMVRRDVSGPQAAG